MIRRKAVAVTLATTAALWTTAGSALAHQCFIVKRSDVGAINASAHSPNWFHIGSLRDLFAMGHTFLGGAPLTSAQLNWAVEQARAAGFPNELAVFERKTLMAGTPAAAKHANDGKGIDYLSFDTFVAIFFQARSRPA